MIDYISNRRVVFCEEGTGKIFLYMKRQSEISALQLNRAQIEHAVIKKWLKKAGIKVSKHNFYNENIKRLVEYLNICDYMSSYGTSLKYLEMSKDLIKKFMTKISPDNIPIIYGRLTQRVGEFDICYTASEENMLSKTCYTKWERLSPVYVRNQIEFINNKYYIAHDDHSILYSEHPENGEWKVVEVGFMYLNDWIEFRFINGKYILTGREGIAYSNDVEGPWEIILVHDEIIYWNSLQYINNEFIMVGGDKIARSVSGNIEGPWEVTKIKLNRIDSLCSLVYSHEKFMAHDGSYDIIYWKSNPNMWNSVNLREVDCYVVKMCIVGDKYVRFHAIHGYMNRYISWYPFKYVGGKYILMHHNKIAYTDDITHGWRVLTFPNQGGEPPRNQTEMLNQKIRSKWIDFKFDEANKLYFAYSNYQVIYTRNIESSWNIIRINSEKTKNIIAIDSISSWCEYIE